MRRGASGGPGASAYAGALRRLARRDHTRAELRRALLARGHSPEDVELTLGRLRDERLLDDTGYAERYARSRMAHHGHGRARVRQGLRLRGVARAERETGIARALEEVDERAVLEAQARGYWRRHAALPALRRLPRLVAFLVRRGFAPGLVHERLRALWPRYADALAGLEPAEPAAEAPGDDGE
jgi:regulatory protein